MTDEQMRTITYWIAFNSIVIIVCGGFIALVLLKAIEKKD